MMILQLNPPIPMETPKGSSQCHFLIDYGKEDSLYWVCFLDCDGQCWTFSNELIRACKNITLNRTNVDKLM